MVETFTARAVASVLGSSVAIACVAACGAGIGSGPNNAKEVVTEYAARELRCHPEVLRVEEVWGGRWEARGCDQRATYDVDCRVAVEGPARCSVRPQGGSAPLVEVIDDAPLAPH